MGKGKEQLRVNFAAKVLGLRSEFFRVKTKFNSFMNYEDHQNQIIDLSEQNIDAMIAFFAWNTTGDIFSAKYLSKNTIPRDATVTTPQLDGYRVLWDQLLECYFLADFLGAPKFGNAIVDALFNAIDHERHHRANCGVEVEEKIFPHQPFPNTLLDNNENNSDDEDLDDDDENEDGNDDNQGNQARNRVPDPFGLNRPQAQSRQMLGTLPYQIQRMYSNTKKGSPVRYLLVDQLINQGMSCDYYKELHSIIEEGVPLEFLQSLADELMLTVRIAVGNNQNHGMRADHRAAKRCLYHIHKTGESCS